MAAPDLHTQIAALADRSLSDAERVDAIRLLEDLKAHASAAQARLAVDLDDSVRAHHRDLRLPATEHGRGVASQIALARRESPARGSRFLGLARALTTELPRTLAALEAGALSEWRATLIARESACLTPEDRAVVDQRICAAQADGTHRFDGWGERRLTAETQKLAYTLDPHAVVNRAAKAETERRVSLRPAPDTMAQLTALLPAAQGVAVWATLTRAADTLTAAGDARTRGQIMADTLVERVTGQTRADTLPLTVNLVISDQTFLDGGHEPAWLLGYGPLPATTARDLAGRAVNDSLATLRRMYATPTGRLVALESTARTFPPGLAHLLDLRDRTCRTPWCDAPIRHHDHITPHATGGPTTVHNGQGLCQHCNLSKQAPGWRTRPTTGPPDGLHTVETTTPTGHVTRSTAPPTPAPARLRHRSHAEYHFSHLLLVA